METTENVQSTYVTIKQKTSEILSGSVFPSLYIRLDFPKEKNLLKRMESPLIAKKKLKK